MNKKIKNILSFGAVTMLTASSMLPVHALSNTNYTKHVTYKTLTAKGVYIYVNGVKFSLPLKPSCPNIPSNPGVTPENPDTTPEEKPDTTPNKPNNGGNSDNNTTTPSKPDNDNSNTGGNNNNSNNNGNNNDNNTSDDNTTPEEKPDTTPSTNFSAYQQQVLDLANVERTKRGLSPLTLDSSLSNIATKKSQDMATKNYFSHTSPTYGSPFDMMRQFGISYSSAGENIAKGQKTPQEVVTAWMNSEGHRANILNSSFTNLGVGIAKDSNGTTYWTQMFIGK